MSNLHSENARELGNGGYGLLAFQSDQIKRTLEVLQSAAGFYLGTFDEEGPFTRESQEYWGLRDHAVEALSSGRWTQRQHL